MLTCGCLGGVAQGAGSADDERVDDGPGAGSGGSGDSRAVGSIGDGCPPQGRCGDGVIDPGSGEVCDPGNAATGTMMNLGNETCSTLGMSGDGLACNCRCQFNMDACSDVDPFGMGGTGGFGGTGGIGDGGGGGSGTCVDLASQLRACGLLGPGIFSCEEPQGPAESCQADCLASADCMELDGLLCTGDSLLLESCLNTCGMVGGGGSAGEFNCNNGNVVPAAWICDGDNDCGDLSDEQACPAQATFRCDNGRSVSANFQCDTDNDCGDGSDERGCAERLCP